MGEHDDVGVDTYDGASPSHVRFNYVFADEGVGDGGIVDCDEDGGFKLVGGRVIELLHERERLFFCFLGIYAV